MTKKAKAKRETQTTNQAPKPKLAKLEVKPAEGPKKGEAPPKLKVKAKTEPEGTDKLTILVKTLETLELRLEALEKLGETLTEKLATLEALFNEEQQLRETVKEAVANTQVLRHIK